MILSIDPVWSIGVGVVIMMFIIYSLASLLYSTLKWIRDSVAPPLVYPNFEWQFQNDDSEWITYGKPSSKGHEAYVTQISSDDIENHYTNDKDKTPMLLQSQKYQYVLDFKNMTQTNLQTQKRRSVRRYRIGTSSKRLSNNSVGSYDWFFKNNRHWWLKFGHRKTDAETSLSSITTSKEIETHFLEKSNNTLIISNANYKYILDFEKMTQTNLSTKTVRPIRRLYVVPASAVAALSSATVASPSLWTLLFGRPKMKYAIPLDVADTEYKRQMLFVKETLPNCTVENLYRVENKYLRIAYENRKDLLAEQFPRIHFKEMYLFHGTSSKFVQAICSENLDWRLHGSSTGQLYGRGTYFSNSAAESSHYCRDIRTKTMFIVKVLVGRTIKGTSSTVKPPKDFFGQPYDTTVNSVENPSIFVKYDNQEYYPVYYFEFRVC